ncbi:Protein phosphatase inhibitor 2 [Oopsacas minuta]|uniref:Protein phosphatase inhibitor 2 n=1 Tax=Oopsacas minuta TaxID=111878 RepID=A0AAV7KIP6_9METZ|nr:Protein phosphatase inhibitor 2 [Oopsacas minuta]
MAEAVTATSADKLKASRSTRPASILKRTKDAKKETGGLQWDEMNIIATLHPKDKDYGHMKIVEPKTPYEHDPGHEPAGAEKSVVKELADRVESDPTAFVYKEPPPPCIDMDSGSDEETMTPEEKAKHEIFKKKRQLHYNEGAFMKQAREMARRSMVEDDD